MQSWKYLKIEKFWQGPRSGEGEATFFRFFKIYNFALNDFLSVGTVALQYQKVREADNWYCPIFFINSLANEIEFQC